MIANCVVAALVLFLIIVSVVLEQLVALRPYAWVLVQSYSWTLVAVGVVLFVNLFAVVYLVSRYVLLKDTGRKLAHVEKQLRTRDTIVRDLSERLAADE